MLTVRHAFIICAALAVSGCSSSWSTSNVKPATDSKASASSDSSAAEVEATEPSSILVTKDDITDRPYRVLGDIEVTVNKTTLFHPDPTPALVDEELREEAAELGADAVILVRYGTVGVGLASWGSLDGKGRAIAFEE